MCVVTRGHGRSSLGSTTTPVLELSRVWGSPIQTDKCPGGWAQDTGCDFESTMTKTFGTGRRRGKTQGGSRWGRKHGGWTGHRRSQLFGNGETGRGRPKVPGR